MELLKVTNITKSIGKNQILNQINFSLNNDAILGILGPSGSGKTTLLRIIAGLDEPDAGEIYLNDKLTNDPQIRITVNNRKIGFVFQDLALWPHMNAYQHLEFVVEDQIKEIDQQKEEIVQTFLQASFPLEKQNQYPHQLSGGEKQRLAIARCLIQNPKLLIMDEPLANLDELLKLEILNQLITIHQESHLPILYVTHTLEEIKTLTQQVLVLDQGRQLYFGTLNNIPKNSEYPYLNLINRLTQ